MAKRFSDSNKWKKPFLKTLKPEYKLFWLYLLDECDHAGIWQIEIDIAEARIGMALDLEIACKKLGKKIVLFDNNEKLFIPDFILFQYGAKLNEKNKVHKSVIDVLKKYKLPYNENTEEKLSPLGENLSPLQGPCKGAKDKEKDKDMDKDKDTPDFKISELENSQVWIEQIGMKFTKFPPVQIKILLKDFLTDLKLKDDLHKPIPEIKNHFINWLKLQTPKQQQKQIEYYTGDE